MTIEELKKIFIPKNTRVDRNNLSESKTGAVLYNDAVSLYDAIILAAPSGALSDGDKGDIIVSGSGSTWKIDQKSATTNQVLTWNGTNWVPQNPSAGVTNLNQTVSAVNIGITSDTGTDVVLPLVTTTLAGLMSPGDKVKLNGITGTNTGDVSVTDSATIDFTLAGQNVSGSVINNSITNAKLNTVPANTIKGNNTGSTANPTDLTASQVKSMLSFTAADIANTPAGNLITTNVQAAINELDAKKHSSILFKDEGVALGVAGNVSEINFTGTAVTATRSGNIVTVDIPATTGVTNLGYTASAINGIITNSSGSAATLPLGTGTNAGLQSPTDKSKLDLIGITQAVNLDTVESNVNNLVTLSGVAADSTNLGTFTGAIIPDNVNVKAALQALETDAEIGDSTSNGITGNGRPGTPHKLGGTFVQNTTIDGADFNLQVINAGTVQLESDSTSRTHRSELLLSGGNIVGAYMRHINKSDINQNAQVSLDLDTTMGLTYQAVSGQDIGFKIVPGATTALSKLRVETPNSALGTATTGQSLVRQSDGTVEFQTVSGGGSSISEYNVTSGTANSYMRVVATDAGATSSYASNEFTVTPPIGGRLLSLDLRLSSSDILTGADAGGFTNSIKVKFMNTGGNTDTVNYTDIRIPSVQKVALPSTSPLAMNNSATFDLDNAPQVSVVAMGSGSITIRVSGLSIGTKGYHLKFSNI